MTELAKNYTDDTLFGGKVLIRQPLKGYRVAIDPIFLAAAVPAQNDDKVLDIGCGIGAASICLAYRLNNVRVHGVDSERECVRLAAENVQANNQNGRLEIIHGDLSSPPPRFSPGSYSHVMVNPPFFENASGRISPYIIKANSNHEGNNNLESWLRFCLTMVQQNGTITLVHRPERLDEILSILYGKVGDIKIFPLWPTKNKPAKRLIIQGIKGSKGESCLFQGMVLHTSDNKYTPEAEEILWHGKALDW